MLDVKRDYLQVVPEEVWVYIIAMLDERSIINLSFVSLLFSRLTQEFFPIEDPSLISQSFRKNQKQIAKIKTEDYLVRRLDKNTTEQRIYLLNKKIAESIFLERGSKYIMLELERVLESSELPFAQPLDFLCYTSVELIKIAYFSRPIYLTYEAVEHALSTRFNVLQLLQWFGRQDILDYIYKKVVEQARQGLLRDDGLPLKYWAIACGQLDEVKKFTYDDTQLVLDYSDKTQHRITFRNALLFACFYGQADILAFLLQTEKAQHHLVSSYSFNHGIQLEVFYENYDTVNFTGPPYLFTRGALTSGIKAVGLDPSSVLTLFPGRQSFEVFNLVRCIFQSANIDIEKLDKAYIQNRHWQLESVIQTHNNFYIRKLAPLFQTHLNRDSIRNFYNSFKSIFFRAIDFGEVDIDFTLDILDYMVNQSLVARGYIAALYHQLAYKFSNFNPELNRVISINYKKAPGAIREFKVCETQLPDLSSKNWARLVSYMLKAFYVDKTYAFAVGFTEDMIDAARNLDQHISTYFSEEKTFDEGEYLKALREFRDLGKSQKRSIFRRERIKDNEPKGLVRRLLKITEKMRDFYKVPEYEVTNEAFDILSMSHARQAG